MNKVLRLGILLIVIACGAAACASPVTPAGMPADASLSQSAVPEGEQTAQAPTATDSTAARNGGNLMGGN